MDESYSMSDAATKQLERAQRILNRVQKKLSTYKKDQKNIQFTKIPSLDINKYLSYLIQPQQSNLNDLTVNRPPNNNYKLPKTTVNQELNLQQFQINQKIAIDLNIQRLENLYEQKNRSIDLKIKQLKNQSEKIDRDKKLLLMENQQLQEQLKQLNPNSQINPKIILLKTQIQEVKKRIESVTKNNQKTKIKNKQLESQIKEGLNQYKDIVKNDIPRVKSKSGFLNKCPYH